MGNWPRHRLEDLAADEKSAISKPWGSAMLRDDYRPAGIPVVRGVNLARGRFHDDDFVYIDAELAEKMPGAELRQGDLVVTHRGTVGQVSMIPRKSRYDRYVASTSHVKVRLNPARAVPEFFYYWFQSQRGRRSILEYASSVGVPGIAQPVATVKRLEVPCPSLQTQHRIADLLGAFDDKIAVNNQIASSLLELADATFQRSVQNVPLGQATFATVAEIGGGGTPKTSVEEYWGGDIAWATPTDVTALTAPYIGSTSRTVTESGLAACGSSLYPTGSILMTSRATIGAFAVAQTPVAVNQGFIVLNAKNPTAQWWLFHELRSRVPELLSYANGATFLELSRGRFKNIPARLAPQEDLARFSDTVRPMHAHAAQLSVQTRELASARDQMLSLLMSEQLHIDNTEEVREAI